MEHRSHEQRTGARFMALDWGSLGKVVRDEAAEAVSLHLANLGATDNPIVRDFAIGSHIPGAEALAAGSHEKRFVSDSQPRPVVLEIRL